MADNGTTNLQGIRLTPKDELFHEEGVEAPSEEQLEFALRLAMQKERLDELAAQTPYDYRLQKHRKNLIVFDGDPHHNWVEIFDGYALPDGSSLYVVQCSWMEVSISSYGGDGNCSLTVAPIRESDGKIRRPAVLGVRPDFVLIRNQARGAVPSSDARRILYGLMTANVPSINSLFSMYMHLERPIMYAGLRRVQKKLGRDDFPLIDQTYFSGHKEMIISPSYPCILKVRSFYSLHN